MYYSTVSSNYRVITRTNANRYLSKNTRIPDHVYGIATEAFQGKTMIHTVNFPNVPHFSRRIFRVLLLISHRDCSRETANCIPYIFIQTA